MLRPVLFVSLLLMAGCLAPAATQAEVGDPVTFEAARFETDHGVFVAVLFPDQTPDTVGFFKRLVSSGYYDGREFNRVIPGFVIQEVDRVGGATDQTGRVKAEFGTDVMFSAGALGIARDEAPDSGGSEFFVMDFAHSHLYGNYTAFAQVVEGLEVVHAIARVPTVQTPGAFVPGVPVGVHDRVAVEPPTILSARLVSVTLPASVASGLPLMVGETTRAEGVRYTLEWPRDLAAAGTVGLTWYVYTAGEAPAGIESFRVVVDGPGGQAEVPTTGDPADARIRHFAWPALATPGEYGVSLVRGQTVLATTNVTAQ